MARLKLLLQCGLEIRQLIGIVLDIVDLRLEKPQHHPACLVDAGIEIDRSDDGFKRVDEQRLLGPATRLFLALSQLQVSTQMNLLRIFDKIGGADEETLQFRKLALRQTGMSTEKKITDKETQ